jgi:hypothetical protein
MSEASRAFNAATIQVSLNTARDALTAAFGAAMQVEDLDGPLCSAISRAQTEVKTAQAQKVEWHAPQTSPSAPQHAPDASDEGAARTSKKRSAMERRQETENAVQPSRKGPS